MIKYRSLTAKEIETLEKNECRADSWDNIQVVDNFTPEFISKTKFSGKILLGEFEKEFQQLSQDLSEEVVDAYMLETFVIEDEVFPNIELAEKILAQNEIAFPEKEVIRFEEK